MPGDGNQRLVQIEIAPEALRAVDEPEIHLIFHCADIGEEFSRIAFGIVNEVARMHLKKSGKQHACRISKVRPRPTLNLREIRLADSLTKFLSDCPNDLLLRHRSSQAAKRPLDFTQIMKFITQSHIYR